MVHKEARKLGTSAVNVSARDLAVYTIRITANEKVFLPEYKTPLTNEITRLAISIHTLCWSARNLGGNDPEACTKRTGLLDDAILACNNLLSLIDIAKPLYHLDTSRVKYWASKTIETRTLIILWRDSGAKR